MKECNYCLYKHTNIKNGKIYIGVTCQVPKNRWNNGKGYRGQTLIYRAIMKYGWDNFNHDIMLEGLSKEEAEVKEREIILLYKSNDKKYGYNIENGGNLAGKHSDYTKKKISDANKGVPKSEEHKRKLRENRIGKSLSMETREKISKTNTGKTHTKESKEKISNSRKGDKNCNYGKRPSDYVIAASVKATSKPIYQYDKSMVLIKQWNSCAIASKELNIISQNINACCNGGRGSAGGFIWKFKNNT